MMKAIFEGAAAGRASPKPLIPYIQQTQLLAFFRLLLQTLYLYTPWWKKMICQILLLRTSTKSKSSHVLQSNEALKRSNWNVSKCLKLIMLISFPEVRLIHCSFLHLLLL